MNHHILLRRCVCLIAAIAIMLCAAPDKAAALTSPGPVAGTSAIVADAESGAVLFEFNSDEAIEPASTTKVMTALLIFEAIGRGELSLDEKVTATQAIIDGVVYDASRVLPYIADGEEMTVRQYLQCILMVSDCVACDVMAQRVCGSVDAFVARMNERAEQLGCTNTHFVNTHGYPAEGHYTTARSLCLILREAVRYPEFCEIFGTIKAVIEPTNKNEKRNLYNSDWMLWDPAKIKSIYCRYYYPYATGGKTGSSKKTGHCLASTAEKDGLRLVCVITGTHAENDPAQGWVNRSFSETQRLCDWAFANYSYRDIVSAGDVVSRADVDGGEIGSVALTAESGARLLLPGDIDPASLGRDIELYGGSISAPVSAGDVVGELHLTQDGESLATVRLAAAQDIAAATIFHRNKDKSGGQNNALLIVLISLVMLIAGVLLFAANYRRPVSGEHPDVILGSGADPVPDVNIQQPTLLDEWLDKLAGKEKVKI